ncbi:hypothetical protein H2202_006064 [Exophiala xenobiotica]|nr:hypothetical protein H2202_006064 [Exophiala xenobiotica]KAK5212566.1 hypothetical protein LTR41_001512 [Exophiala xenobiotica]KAK5414781.1 hypothetical protein LTR06_004596 [Exophiala xenobiotica]
MQKILRINLLARNQALKATRKKNLKKLKADWREYDRRQIETEKTKREYLKDERKHRREDWIAGPLAPKRNVAEKADTYGAVSALLVQGPEIPKRALKGPKGTGSDQVGSEGRETEQKEWEGEGNEGNILAGDRVCVVIGDAGIRGRIGTALDVNLERKQITIEGLNMADVELPPGTRQREKMPFQSTEMPIPLDAVRLVYKATDETTGREREVIVKHLRGGAPYIQRPTYSKLPRHTRYIAGEEIEIPWPEDDSTSYQAYAGDTTRYDVESQTYNPSLWVAPLPQAGILDELRNDKYARDREWHEDEYVRMKILEDARARWYEQRKVTTPEAEWAEEKKRLAAQKAESVKAMGVSDVTADIIRRTQAEKRTSKRRRVRDTEMSA